MFIITSSISWSVRNLHQVFRRTQKLHVEDPKLPTKSPLQMTTCLRDEDLQFVNTHILSGVCDMMSTRAGLCDYAVCTRVLTGGEEGVPLFLPLAVTSAHQGSEAPAIPPSIPPAGRFYLVKGPVYSRLRCFIQQPSGLDTLSTSFFFSLAFKF